MDILQLCSYSAMQSFTSCFASRILLILLTKITSTARQKQHAKEATRAGKLSSTNLPMQNHVCAICKHCKPCPHCHVFCPRCPNMGQTMDILQLRSWCFQLLTSSLLTSHHSHDLQNATKSYQIQISHIPTLKYTKTGYTQRARTASRKSNPSFGANTIETQK